MAQPRLALGVCLSVLLALAASRQVNGDSPWFCHGLDCPTYTVQETVDGVELRAYDAAAWVSTKVTGSSYAKAQITGFDILLKYIGGANSDGTKIAMTAPVRVRMLPTSSGLEENFIFSFFLPFDYQLSPPTPTSPDVYIEEVPKMTVYVSSFGGYAKEATIVKTANDLLDALQNRGADVIEDSYFFCGYDNPFRVLDRHNEVWFVEKNTTGLISVT
ncbi:unnamed protein product [Ostreobium quekettii]|uniref:Heme-binding protein 2 n=1 Tax=Ostreobium quekettii TaxID=121088 RepID=A0A8S1JFD9_9CHLO|nr:unnamed protein product [Ostreobium quekettii]